MASCKIDDSLRVECAGTCVFVDDFLRFDLSLQGEHY